MGGGGRREAGGGEGEGARDTESKTRTPHKDVGKNTTTPKTTKTSSAVVETRKNKYECTCPVCGPTGVREKAPQTKQKGERVSVSCGVWWSRKCSLSDLRVVVQLVSGANETGLLALCPLDWPSNYSLLRLWHMAKDPHLFADQLRKQMNHRHMFSHWEIP